MSGRNKNPRKKTKGGIIGNVQLSKRAAEYYRGPQVTSPYFPLFWHTTTYGAALKDIREEKSPFYLDQCCLKSDLALYKHFKYHNSKKIHLRWQQGTLP